MMKNSLFVFLTILILGLVAVQGCTQGPTPNIDTPQPSGTVPLFPTQTPTLTLTNTSTSIPTATYTPTATFMPITPALAGENLPESGGVISEDNVERLTLLARWGDGYGRVGQLKFTPDGKYLVAASSIGLYFYDAEHYTLVKFISTNAEILDIAISPDSQRIAASTFDKVLLYNIDDDALVLTFASSTTSRIAFLHPIAFSPDGEILATGSENPSGVFVQLWNTNDGTLIRNFEESDAYIKAITFSPNGMFLATGGDSTKIWTLDGILLDSHGPYVNGGGTLSLSFSPDGKFLVEGVDDQSVHIWEVTEDGKLINLRWISIEDWYSGSVVTSPNGKILAAGTGKGLYLWNLDTTVQIAKLEEYFDFSFGRLSWSTDSATLAYSTNGKEIKIWNTTNNTNQIITTGFAGPINALAWSSIGSNIAIGTDYGITYLLNAKNGVVNHKLGSENSQNTVNSLAYSSDAQMLAVGLESDKAQIWDMNGIMLKELDGYSRFGSTDVAFSPDGSMLFTNLTTENYDVESIQIWHTIDWSFYKGWDLGDIHVTGMVFVTDRNFFAFATNDDERVQIRDFSTNDVVQNLGFSTQWSNPYVQTISFSPNWQILATLSGERDFYEEEGRKFWLTLWNTHDWKEIYSLPLIPLNQRKGTASNFRNGIAWSLDGSLLAIGIPDGSIQILRTSDGEILQTLTGHTLWVTGVVFSPDGRMLASASLDGTVRIWGLR